jgi:tetratricopeptide repeat protein
VDNVQCLHKVGTAISTDVITNKKIKMRSSLFILIFVLISCSSQDKRKNQEEKLKTVPITTNSEEAKEHFIRARYLIQNGIYSDEVYEHFDEAIKLDSTFVRMYNYLSVYRADDSIKMASHILSKRYKHLASKEEQLLIDATEYRFNNPEDSLERILHQVAELCPDDKYLFHTICYLLIEKNPRLSALAGERAIEIDSTYAGGYNNLGYAYMNGNEYDKAEIVFNKYIDVLPNRGNPYDSKADLLMELGRYEEALSLKRKAYEIDTTLYWIPEEIPQIQTKIDSIKNK